MASKTIRYQPHINAIVVLEKFVIEDWTATDQRGQVSKTKDKTIITVFPDAYHVKINGAAVRVEQWCKNIEAALGQLNDNSLEDDFLDPLLVKGTRGYIEAVVRQINVSFKAEAYDAAAVLIRRLAETLIIELFEAKHIDHKIKNSLGDFVHLAELVSVSIAECNVQPSAWNLGRNAKSGLKELKNIGDLSAHNRKYLAKRTDIKGVQTHLRVVVEELLITAGLK